MLSNENPASIAAPMQESASLERAKLNLSGMRCAACVQLIEFRVRQLPGVISFKINVASHRAEIAWQPALISIKKIIVAIIDLGYGALPSNQSQDALAQKENKLSLWRLFVAGFAMMQVMMYAFPAYLVPVPQIDGDLTPDLDKLLKLASMVIAIPVVGFSATPFFKSAWRDLRNRHIGMDVPVSLGILLTFFASVWATFKGGVVYYDSVIMFVFLLLGARLIESKVQRKTNAALCVLTQISPQYAQRLPDYPLQRHAEPVDAADIKADDVLLIVAGEHIPADGMVLEGGSECDESLMTGESHPVSKTIGSELIAGSINLNGALIMQAHRVGDDTQVSALIRMMEAAATEKPPLVQLADKHASRFLTVILLLALLTAIVWSQLDPARALWIAISVIVVTCPCALSLATPGVMSAAIGLLAKNGVLVAKGKAIQALATATHFVFDKTGTLTVGKLRLVDTIVLREMPQAEMISLWMTSQSNHPVSKAIADTLSAQRVDQSHYQLENLREIAGGGIEANFNGKTYRLGNPEFVAQLHSACIDIPPALNGKTLSALGNEDGGLLLFALEDVLRDDAAQAIHNLQSRGKTVLLLSGDREEVVRKIAVECGISQAWGELSPAEKHDSVQRLQADGAIVVMVGDGMNDGPVLALADVAVAMGQGAPLSQSRSDLLLMSNRLSDLDFGFVVAGKAFRLIRENLSWAILYNLVAIPAAVTGLLEPWHAALGMSLSSLIVVINALRLYLLPQPLRLMPEESIG
ncbi:MAG: cadmium-translocating P-type ATPase [Burkholderiales bacterium]|nr:cadmium-translocating P-type ATPase [Burkholderiales bacterium]